MSSRSMLPWLLLLAAGTLAGCASAAGPQAASGGPAADSATAASGGPAPATPEQVFQSNQTVVPITPNQTRMLGPAPSAGQALTLAPGL